MDTIGVVEYSEAILSCIKLAQQSTSGGRVAAQVLLSAYNGNAFQLDVAGLSCLDRANYEAAITVIRGRHDTCYEPHKVITDGGVVFLALWEKWEELRISAG